MAKMAKKEYIIKHKAYEQGKIKAWQHIILLAQGCIRAHKPLLTRKEIKEICEINKQ